MGHITDHLPAWQARQIAEEIAAERAAEAERLARDVEELERRLRLKIAAAEARDRQAAAAAAPSAAELDRQQERLRRLRANGRKRDTSRATRRRPALRRITRDNSPAELRAFLARAERDGHAHMAKLLRAAVARAEGRSVAAPLERLTVAAAYETSER